MRKNIYSISKQSITESEGAVGPWVHPTPPKEQWQGMYIKLGVVRQRPSLPWGGH